MKYAKEYAEATEALVGLGKNAMQDDGSGWRQEEAAERVFQAAADLVDYCTAEILQENTEKAAQLLRFAQDITDIGAKMR